MTFKAYMLNLWNAVLARPACPSGERPPEIEPPASAFAVAGCWPAGGARIPSAMADMLPPRHVRYALTKILAGESSEPMWPTVAGATAASIAARYEEDYRRCLDVSQMIRADLRANNSDEGRVKRVPSGAGLGS